MVFGCALKDNVPAAGGAQAVNKATATGRSVKVPPFENDG